MLDTCIVIDFERHGPKLPDRLGISAVVLAEMRAGVAVTSPGEERSRRLTRLRWAATFLDPLVFGPAEVDAYGRVVAATRRAGRSERPRVADLMIAATAAAQELPLYTVNADDFVGLDGVVEVIAI